MGRKRRRRYLRRHNHNKAGMPGMASRPMLDSALTSNLPILRVGPQISAVSFSFRALVDPRPNQAYLFSSQRFWWGAETSWTAPWSWRRTTTMVGVRPPIRTTPKLIRSVLATGSSRACRTTGAAPRAATTRSAFWGHRGILVNLGGGNHQETLGAVSRSYHFAVLPSVQHPFKAV